MRIYELRAWLEEVYDGIDDIFDPSEENTEWHYYEGARIAQVASDEVRRAGGGDYAMRRRDIPSFPDGTGCMGRDALKTYLGKLIKWCHEHETWPNVLSLREASRYLGMSESGLRKLVRRRAIRFSQAKKGAAIKFQRTWLDDYIAAKEERYAPPPKRRGSSTRVPNKHGLDPNLVG